MYERTCPSSILLFKSPSPVIHVHIVLVGVRLRITRTSLDTILSIIVVSNRNEMDSLAEVLPEAAAAAAKQSRNATGGLLLAISPITLIHKLSDVRRQCKSEYQIEYN